MDALGNPLRFRLIGGESHDITEAEALIADKRYDALPFLAPLLERGGMAYRRADCFLAFSLSIYTHCRCQGRESRITGEVISYSGLRFPSPLEQFIPSAPTCDRQRLLPGLGQYRGGIVKGAELPQGYATILSQWLSGDEPGVTLSGGEWQKVAFARTIMKNQDLMVIDEPTSNLDALSELEFSNLVASRFNKVTTILVSHQLGIVRSARKIAVMEDGRIGEMGSHQELMNMKRTYFTLYESQVLRNRTVDSFALERDQLKQPR